MVGAEIKSIVTPSIKTISATFNQISTSAKFIEDNIKSVLDTLKVVDDTLDVFTNSASLSGQLRAINPFALLPTTVRLATEIVSRYVTKKTGISFVDWAQFVDSILGQFEEYTEQLDKIAKLSLKYNELSLGATSVDEQEVSDDELLLVNAKLKTRIWKGYIERIAKLVLVIDAIIDAQRETIQQTTTNKEDNIDINSDVKKMLGVVTDKIDTVSQNRAKELLLYFFSSVYDLKNKTQNFNVQTRDLLPKISELENLLDLVIAQIKAFSGRISLKEVEILEARVAATILVPQLKERLACLQRDIAQLNCILEKLNMEYEAKEIKDSIYNLLSAEYGDKLYALTASFNQAENELSAWKTDGMSCLEDGLEWIRTELEIVRTRKLVGQISTEELQQRSMTLNQELRRLDTAKNMLNNL